MTDHKAVMQQALDALEAMQMEAAQRKYGLKITDDSIIALREAIAQPEQPANAGEVHFPIMCKAFRTTVSQGLDKRYEMVFAFPDLTALHAADTEWLDFREAAIAQPTQARMLRNLVATMLTKEPIEQPEPVSQPLTHKEIQEIWEIWESQVFPIIDLETVHPPIAQPEQPAQHDLQKRLSDLHKYEEIAEFYAQCAISPEALRDWVSERMDMTAIAQPEQTKPEWHQLSDLDRQQVFESLPDMLDGFLKTWGWLHFAKGIEAKCREKNIAQPEQTALSHADAELVWAIAQNKWNAQADQGNQWDALGRDEMSLLIVRETELQLSAITQPKDKL